MAPTFRLISGELLAIEEALAVADVRGELAERRGSTVVKILTALFFLFVICA